MYNVGDKLFKRTILEIKPFNQIDTPMKRKTAHFYVECNICGAKKWVASLGFETQNSCRCNKRRYKLKQTVNNWYIYGFTTRDNHSYYKVKCLKCCVKTERSAKSLDKTNICIYCKKAKAIVKKPVEEKPKLKVTEPYKPTIIKDKPKERSCKARQKFIKQNTY